MNVEVVIAAGGKSSRFNKRQGQNKAVLHNKLLYKVSDTPIIALTLLAFLPLKYIRRITLVTAITEEELSKIQQAYNLPFELQLALPGEMRQESVYNGLQKLPSTTDVVVVHDGARPLIDSRLIQKSIEVAYQEGGAVVAVPVHDTLKKVQEECISETIDRSNLWAAQTPQTFRYDLLMQAHKQALKEGIQATDDAMLLELMGCKPKIVEGSRRNIKITTYEDILLVEFLLRRFKENDAINVM